MKKVLHIFFLCLMSLVALVANAQITSVSELNNTTTYTLKTTERGYFLYNEATSTEALTSSYNLDGGQNATPTGEASQQFAFLHGTYTPEGKYYLYSVGAGKFVGFNTADVKTYLKDAPTTADRVTLTASGSNFILADATNRKVNISTWQAFLGVKVVSCDPDGGNLLVVTAVNTSADFTEALSVIDALEAPKPQYTVTFTFKQNGEVLGSQAVTLNEGSAFPSYSVPSYVEATVEGSLPETVTENTEIVVNTTVKDDCPFKFYQATDAADVVWTALTLKRSPVLYLYATEDGTQISNTAVETLPSDETLKKYAWCFVGDWLNGFTINNLATGKRIASPSTALTDGTDYHAILTDATLEDGTDKFKLVTNSAGNYFIKRADTDNYFLSNFGGTTNTLLSFWNSGNALTDGGTGDGGSIFEVVAITLPEPVLNTLVPTVEPTTATGTLETITLNFEKEVTYDNTKTITLGNRMMGITKDITVAVSAEDAKVVTITLAEPVTEPGYLSLYIPEETFTATEDGTFNPELTSPITVLAPTNSFAFESTTPADNANLLELSTVKVTYTNAPTLATEGASVNVINTETSTAVTTATVAYDAEDRNSVVFTLAEAITTPGTYTLTIPDEFIWNSQYNDIAEDKGVSQGATYTPATTLTFNVIEPYPVNFDKNMNSSRADRTLRSITLTEEGQAGQTVTVANTSKIYNDQHETATLTCAAGSTLTATFSYSGTWMHGYVYIDTENDGAFSFNEGNTDQSGTDLKAFAFYSGDFNNDASGYNSAGQNITGNDRANINPPSFTAPTTPGTYRIRFKVDWNSVDPGGQKAADGTVTSSNGIAANGGYILDATLEVTEPSPLAPLTPTSVTPAAGETVSSFTAATLTFDTDINYDSEKTVSIYDRSYNTYTATVTVEGNTATISVAEPITQTGYYTIEVPASTFTTEEGRSNDVITTSFIVQAPANSFEYESVSPANGTTVASLSSITLTYSENVNGTIINESPIEVTDAEGNTVTTATLSTDMSIWNIVHITLASEIKTNGTYTLTIPEEFIGNEAYIGSQPDKGAGLGGKYNPAFTLTYTVDSTLGIDTLTIDNAAGKTVYSIDGRKVSGKLQRGTYIIDGQKRFVK